LRRVPFPARRAPAPARTHDPEGVKRDIIAMATEEFAQMGCSGARVDAIAARYAAAGGR
jgi:AcrR family transcriptional regulator